MMLAAVYLFYIAWRTQFTRFAVGALAPVSRDSVVFYAFAISILSESRCGWVSMCAGSTKGWEVGLIAQQARRRPRVSGSRFSRHSMQRAWRQRENGDGGDERAAAPLRHGAPTSPSAHISMPASVPRMLGNGPKFLKPVCVLDGTKPTQIFEFF